MNEISQQQQQQQHKQINTGDDEAAEEEEERRNCLGKTNKCNPNNKNTVLDRSQIV